VVKLDKILNKAIKATLEALALSLANIITTCLYKSKILKSYKIIIIIILKKANKKDYCKGYFIPYLGTRPRSSQGYLG